MFPLSVDAGHLQLSGAAATVNITAPQRSKQQQKTAPQVSDVEAGKG